MTTKTETLRTFIALPLSESMINKLRKVQSMLRRQCPAQAVRWVNPENIHLTLFFLGDILPNRVQPIEEALDVVARYVQPITVSVQGIGAFPNVHRPRVIWLGVEEPTGKLALLHQAVNEAMTKVGFQPEKRRFSPHLTLGRLKRRAARRDVSAVGQTVEQAAVDILGEVRVDTMIFFRSFLKSSGAEYTPLKTFSLRLA